MYKEIIFADGINVYRVAPSSTTVDESMESLGRVQNELHLWVSANQVASASAQAIIHHAGFVAAT